MIVALLIGRKGSQGFPGKNKFKVLGYPLAYYPMIAAKNSRYINETFLSTDDADLMKIAEENQVKIVERPDYLCTNEALGEDVFVHGYGEIKRLYPGQEIELIVLMFCNAPIVSSENIDKGVNILRERPELDSAVTVSKYNMWSPLRARRINDRGCLEPFVPFETFGDPEMLNCDRDSQGDVWFADMGASIVRPRCLENIENGMLPQKWMGRKIFPIKQHGGLDVDYRYQIGQIEYLLRMQGRTSSCRDDC